MNRNYTNINEIAEPQLDTIYQFCLTYTVQPKQQISYTTNKGIIRKRYYNTLPFKAQKEFLLKGIEKLNSVAYYFEQHNDGRYHLHYYCTDTPRNILEYLKDRYDDNKMTNKKVLHDKLILCEIVKYPPVWVSYCQKNQDKKDIFPADIEKYTSQEIDSGIDFSGKVHIITREDYENNKPYLFGKKNFYIEI